MHITFMSIVLSNIGHGGYLWRVFGFPPWSILWRMAAPWHHTWIWRCHSAILRYGSVTHMSVDMEGFWLSAIDNSVSFGKKICTCFSSQILLVHYFYHLNLERYYHRALIYNHIIIEPETSSCYIESFISFSNICFYT
jgi:hypothetical protein